VTQLWLNGALVDEDEARVSPFDHGLLTGDGVFETLVAVNGQPFAESRHLERLARSADLLGLPLPDPGALRAALREVLAANRLDHARVRITVTGGPSPLGSERGTAPPSVIVAASPPTQWPDDADVVVCPWTRNERGALAGSKTTSYAENVVALAWARRRGAAEALFANCAGDLCEGTGTNVFVAVAGDLVTPPLTSGCLAGVTRALLLELGHGREAALTPDDLRGASEAFLTSSTRGVQPIATVDGDALPLVPGPLTSAAGRAFADLLRVNPDP
jgi:branched-chain amino acid aminotransferase